MGILNWGAAFSSAGGAIAGVGMEGVRAALEQDKIRLADQLAEGRSVREGERAEARQIAAEKRAPGNRRALLAAETPEMVARAKDLQGVELEGAKARRQAEIDIDTNPANIGKKIDAMKQMAPAEARIKADAEVQSLLAKANTPGYVEAVRRIAQATQVLTPGQVAEGKLKELELSRSQTLETMRKAYTSAINAGDKETAGNVAQGIAAYSYDPTKESQAVAAARAVVASIDASAEQKAVALDVLVGVAKKPQGGGGQEYPTPGPVNVEKLKKNPDKAAEFDKVYGPGAAAKILGSAPAAPVVQPATPSGPPAGRPRTVEDFESTNRGLINWQSMGAR